MSSTDTDVSTDRPIPSPGTVRLPELLAPAGSKEALYAAIAAGADAVYLSGKRFGARKFAQNFSEDEIAEAIVYAHARGVRVYVTVNTLIHDRELPGVLAYLVRLYAAGVDAVLVQDAGLARLAKEIVPGLVLHASTQLTIHNADGVRWAKAMGFSRVVLARELPLSEVEAIARATAGTGIGLEVFAHGALCYGYSGQCLLSSAIGGRSGNRGMCAQPCRKCYTLVTARTDRYGRPVDPQDLATPGPYLLSPKDLCTYRDIPRLVHSPVAALKIEGRMKSPEYVAVVVSTYLRALDAAAAGTFVPDETAVRDLALAFSRGFTRGYLFGDKRGKLMARDRPDNRGVLVGTVIRYDPTRRTALIRPELSVTLRPGDGLLFSRPGRPDADWGFSLNTEPAVTPEGIAIPVPRPAEKGEQVSLTASVDLAARARQIVKQETPALRHPVPVALVATVARPDGLLVLSGTVYPPGRAPVPLPPCCELRLEPAKTHPLTREQLAAQLGKTGGTPFTLSDLALDYDGTRFAPIGEINRVRREFFNRAGTALAASFLPSGNKVSDARRRLECRHADPEAPPAPKATGQKPEILLWADRPEVIDAGARAGAGTICYEPCGDVEPAIRSALEYGRAHTARLVWKLPRITREAEIARIRQVLPGLYAAGLRTCMTDNPGAAAAVTAAAPGIDLAGSVGLNVFNAETARVFKALSFTLLTLSPELSARDIEALAGSVRNDRAGPSLAVFAQGNLETMVTEDCLLSPQDRCSNGRGVCSPGTWYGIRDGTGHLLPFRTDGACRGHIFNAAETCLVAAVPDLVRWGITGFVIDVRGRTAAYAEEMTTIYREAIGMAATGSTGNAFAALRERAREAALGGITAGHYQRGLAEDAPQAEGERLNGTGKDTPHARGTNKT